MSAGPRRNLVTVEQPADPPPKTASGAVNKDDPGYWLPFATAWVKFQTISGIEKFAGAEFNTQTTHYVYGLQSDLVGITTKMRLVFGTRTFDILSINDLTAPIQQITLEVREGRSKGN